MKVLGIGETVMDKTCILQNFPDEGSKVQPEKVEHSVGGPVPAALILLSKLGADCKLVTSLGKDTLGRRVKKQVESHGVKVIPHNQRATKCNTLLVVKENGTRTIIRDFVNHTPIKSVDLRLLHDADLVIFDRHEPLAFDFVMENKLPKTKVIVDPSTEVSPKTIKMFEKADYPIVPVESLGKIRRFENFKANLDHLHSITQKPVVVTAGPKGCLIYDGSEIDLVHPVDINCIDADGAGDIFRGAFGYGVLMDWGLKKATEFANLVAGLQCTKIGNSTAIPSKDEIFAFLDNHTKIEVQIEEIEMMVV